LKRIFDGIYSIRKFQRSCLPRPRPEPGTGQTGMPRIVEIKASDLIQDGVKTLSFVKGFIKVIGL